MNTLQVNVVSAEEMIFSGRARFVALPGENGELGIYPRHTPLITRIKPGSVRIQTEKGDEEFVFVAGGIARGEAMACFLELGAAGVQVGTRLVCATECIAHPAFKKAFLRASARDAVASVQIDPRLPVIPVRALKNAGTEEFTRKQIEVAAMLDRGEIDMGAAQLAIEHFWAGALRRAVIEGDVENGSLMAGQSVGMVKSEEPIAQILQTLLAEAQAALE